MQVQQRVVSQVFQRNRDDIPGAGEPRMCVSYSAFGLETPGLEPRAWFGIQQLIEIAPANLPRRHRSARPDVIELLRASGRTAGTGSASLLRSRAVVLEVALSFILLMAPAW